MTTPSPTPTPTGVAYRDPLRAIVAGTIYPGASVTVYEEDGVTVAAIFADADLATPLSNPLMADSAGRLHEIYAASGTYRIVADNGSAVIDETIDTSVLPLAISDEAPLDDSARALPNAVRYFYQSRTDELTQIYTAADLVTPLDNPLTADDAGVFQSIYLDPSVSYRSILKDSAGRLVIDIDPVNVDDSFIVAPECPIFVPNDALSPPPPFSEANYTYTLGYIHPSMASYHDAYYDFTTIAPLGENQNSGDFVFDFDFGDDDIETFTITPLAVVFVGRDYEGEQVFDTLAVAVTPYEGELIQDHGTLRFTNLGTLESYDIPFNGAYTLTSSGEEPTLPPDTLVMELPASEFPGGIVPFTVGEDWKVCVVFVE